MGISISGNANFERREADDRRQRWAHGLWMGSTLRRRRSLRRGDEKHAAIIDWHDAHWLAAAVLVLLLSVVDAFLTLALLHNGAYEANPFMAPLVAGSGAAFAYWKLGLTIAGIVTLVLFARVRLFGVLPAGLLLYAVLFGYGALVAYEWQLLAKVGTDVISYWRPVPLNYPA